MILLLPTFRSAPTPMGVFSVIEKNRYHHSNIYSGAPMPYMQRTTWCRKLHRFRKESFERL